jgi:hypothetical protein
MWAKATPSPTFDPAGHRRVAILNVAAPAACPPDCQGAPGTVVSMVTRRTECARDVRDRSRRGVDDLVAIPEGSVCPRFSSNTRGTEAKICLPCCCNPAALPTVAAYPASNRTVPKNKSCAASNIPQRSVSSRRISAGYRDLDKLSLDADLQGMRDNPKFQQLVTQLKAPPASVVRY